jgi:hypothetical protein
VSEPFQHICYATGLGGTYVAFVVEGRNRSDNSPNYRVVVFALQSSADAVALANIVFKQCYEAVRLHEQVSLFTVHWHLLLLVDGCWHARTFTPC